MAAPAGASSITVAVRVRPFTIREAAQLTKCDDSPLFLGDGSLAAAPPKLTQKGIRSVIKVVDDKCLVFDPPEDNPIQRFSKSVVPQGKRVKDQTFCFDRVFDDNTTQSDVYDGTTKGLLDSVFDGYNATVFAYGATGCGKTHTITGTAQQPGIIFLTMQELFERIQDVQEEKVTEISLSYLEIYNETIRDLLVQGGSKQGLMLREDANQAVSVVGLSSHHPQNVQDVMDLIIRGNEYRTMSPTEANATSSRSHAVLQINVSQKDRNADVNEPHTMATLSIIDLAGSERASATKNRGERLIEGANINKSLLALGSCINALCDPRKRNHVPYRNSKLTRLLKFSLGGNCRTVMIVCVSPSSLHFDETQNTLRYANRAKNIQTKVTRNVYNVNRHVKDFLKKIDEQMTLINELKQQQKDYETHAFAKFRKQNEKRDAIVREGIARIRSAFEHCLQERQERIGMMKKLRQIERRISLISAWVAGFDTVCDAREDEEPPKSLSAMRKTAQGILAELESSRQHYHQRLAKNNWDRALETALQTGLRQLKESDGTEDSFESSTLMREAELLRSIADREMYTSMLDQEKGGDAPVVQALLQAHFDTIAIINQILMMDEADAVQAAKSLLGKMVNACTSATSQVIKPDGGLPVTEAFAPRKTGTPKRRNPGMLLGPSPALTVPQPIFTEPASVSSSPVKASPRRRKLGGARKGVSFTPKKKSPIKGIKRGVRWRDDTEDGTLAEFQATPKRLDSTPEFSSVEMPPPMLSSVVHDLGKEDSSPIPPPPESAIDLKSKRNRFQPGFLSKKSEGSLTPPSHQLPSRVPSYSSDSDSHSPLREMQPNAAPHRSPLHHVSMPSSDNTPVQSSTPSSSSDDEKPTRTAFSVDRAEAKKIRTAMRQSVGSNSSTGRTHRRRSPTSASAIAVSTGSPNSENSMFTASHARRMVRSERASDVDWKASILSPRPGAIVKAGGRRTTMGAGLEDGPRLNGGLRAGPVRMSSVSSNGGGRSSMAPTTKNVWR